MSERLGLYPADTSISLQVGESVDLVSATASVGLQVFDILLYHCLYCLLGHRLGQLVVDYLLVEGNLQVEYLLVEENLHLVSSCPVLVEHDLAM